MKQSILIFCCALLLAGCGQDKASVEVGESSDKSQVKFTKDVQMSSGISTAVAEKRKLVLSVETYGSIAQDTENTFHVTPGQSGVVSELKAKVGETVKKGASLGTIETVSGENKPIASPGDGIVLALYTKAGDRVEEPTSIMTISDQAVLKASFDLYEKDLSFAELGRPLRIKTTAYPGKEFEGKTTFVSPRVDETTRTVKIGVDVDNKDRLLKFGMFVSGTIENEADGEAVIVPLESLQIVEGKEAVFVKEADELFAIRYVKSRLKTSKEAEIVDGLSGGEEVVSRGSFILKSEFMKDSLGGEE